MRARFSKAVCRASCQHSLHSPPPLSATGEKAAPAGRERRAAMSSGNLNRWTSSRTSQPPRTSQPRRTARHPASRHVAHTTPHRVTARHRKEPPIRFFDFSELLLFFLAFHKHVSFSCLERVIVSCC